eukprot:6179910-Pleurochrysis_carterae.AAC.7
MLLGITRLGCDASLTVGKSTASTNSAWPAGRTPQVKLASAAGGQFALQAEESWSSEWRIIVLSA